MGQHELDTSSASFALLWRGVIVMAAVGGGEQSSHPSCPSFQEGGWCVVKQPGSSGEDIAGRKSVL